MKKCLSASRSEELCCCIHIISTQIVRCVQMYIRTLESSARMAQADALTFIDATAKADRDIRFLRMSPEFPASFLIPSLPSLRRVSRRPFPCVDVACSSPVRCPRDSRRQRRSYVQNEPLPAQYRGTANVQRSAMQL